MQKHEIHRGIRTTTEEIFKSPYLRSWLRAAKPLVENVLLSPDGEREKRKGNGQRVKATGH